MVTYTSERRNDRLYKSGSSIKLSMDYYKILGLDKNKKYSEKQLKKIYHQLSLKFHPDKGKEKSESKFREVAEAYEILKDNAVYNFELTKVKTEQKYERVKTPFTEYYYSNGYKFSYTSYEYKTVITGYVIKDVYYQNFRGTPIEFHTRQRELDFRKSASSELASALASKKDLTLPNIEEYLRDGADLDSLTNNQQAILSFIRGTEKHSVLTFLIENGFEVDNTDINGNTLLMYAAKRGLDDIVKLAIKKGANVKAINFAGKTAAHFARENEKYKALKILVENGSDPEMKDSNDNTLLMYAAKRGIEDIVELAIKKGANVKAINFAGKTAAHFARENEKYKALKILVENGSDPEMIDVNGNILLMYAAKRGLEDIVELAIKKGADVNAVNKEGKTALWFAQTNQKTETEKALIASGANTKNANKYTKYMLEFANNKIKFVLDYHNNAKSAEDAIHKLIELETNSHEQTILQHTETCLNGLDSSVTLSNLYDLCG